MARYILLLPSHGDNTTPVLTEMRKERFTHWLLDLCCGVHIIEWLCIESDDGCFFTATFEAPTLISPHAFACICNKYKERDASLTMLH